MRLRRIRFKDFPRNQDELYIRSTCVTWLMVRYGTYLQRVNDCEWEARYV